MAKSSREIQIEYDKENRNCHVILEAAKAIGLGTTHRDALEDLREAARFYVDSMIDMKLREPNQVVPVEGGKKMVISEQKQTVTGNINARKYAKNHEKYAKFMFGGLLKKINACGKSGRYLEIGAGPGFLTTMLAHANPGITITALDISPEMAKVAGEYIKENNLEDRIRYLVGDVADENLIEGLGDFDMVYSSYSLHEWKDLEKSIRNLWRAVGVNGLLYIYDFRRMSWLRFLPFKSGEKDAIMASPSARKIRNILQRAGVTDYSVKTAFPFIHQTVIARK